MQPLFKDNEMERMRMRFLPPEISVLFVAEAPPQRKVGEEQRFFYFSEVWSSDWLFLRLIKNLYGNGLYEMYLKLRKNRKPETVAAKQEILELFSSDGFFLMDLSLFPDTVAVPPCSQTSDFLYRLEGLEKAGHINKETPIILIKKSVHEALFRALSNGGYRVVNKLPIPFPSCGQQAVFDERFQEAFTSAQGLKCQKTLKRVGSFCL